RWDEGRRVTDGGIGAGPLPSQRSVAADSSSIPRAGRRTLPRRKGESGWERASGSAWALAVGGGLVWDFLEGIKGREVPPCPNFRKWRLHARGSDRFCLGK